MDEGRLTHCVGPTMVRLGTVRLGVAWHGLVEGLESVGTLRAPEPVPSSSTAALGVGWSPSPEAVRNHEGSSLSERLRVRSASCESAFSYLTVPR